MSSSNVTNLDNITTSTIRMYEEQRKVTGTNELGQDAFMQILVAQLANQNPLEPATDTEFIAQMAQFTSLEQMQKMNETIESQAAYGYLGMEVAANSVYDPAEGMSYQQEVLGYVEAITKFGNKEYLQVVDYISGETVLVPPAQVSSVFGPAESDKTVGSMTVDELKELIEQTTSNIIGSIVGPGDEEEGEDEKTEGVEGAEGSSEVEDPAADEEAEQAQQPTPENVQLV